MVSRDREDRSSGAILAAVLGLALTLVVGFAAYFILPKIEAQYSTTGARPPLPIAAAIGLSHWVARSFWVLVVAALLFVVTRRSSPGRSDRPGISE